MDNPIVEKLKHGAALSAEDRRALGRECADVREVAPRTDLIREGERPDYVHAVIEGFGCRYKVLPDGGRQIMAWLVPGDFCDLHVAILGAMDHGVATLSASKVAFISPDAVTRLGERSPALSKALWWATLADEGVLREWLVNMGRRPADRRVAHLFCELLARLRAVGLADEETMDLPLTQTDLADTLGLSSVHVNRVVQQLRDERLISWRGKRLKIEDVEGLTAFAGFDPNYLHLRQAA